MPVLSEPNEEERQERVPGEGGAPFGAADDVLGDPVLDEDQRNASVVLDDTHPVTDTDIEDGDVYDEGYAGAANASEPNAGNAVRDYDPTRANQLSESESSGAQVDERSQSVPPENDQDEGQGA